MSPNLFISDKRDRAALFRERLARAIETRAATRAGLARAIGVDRSTISQLLAPGSTRLPNAQVVGDCAAALGVSADWLLGLSHRPEMASDLVAASLSLTTASRALVDDQIIGWHREAAGYKIRHVPAMLPDLLKTPEMLRWEYAPHLGRTPEQAIAAAEGRLSFMRSGQSDVEIAMPLYQLESLASGTGYYASLPEDMRRAQLDHITHLHDQLFPTIRVFLFDARQLYSAPLSVFGPLMAVLYLGQHYMVFRDTERVTTFTRHFDRLVRDAYVSDRELPGYLAKLRSA